MTPEELAYQENFLYPLYLILIGGLITGGLIPYFNRLHGNKLTEIQHKREESQKRIDREREDYRFELETKERLIEKISVRHVWFLKKFDDLTYSTRENSDDMHRKAIDELHQQNVPISDLITLYLKKSELIKLNHEIFKLMIDALVIALTPVNSSVRKLLLEEFSKTHDVTFSDEELKYSMKSARGTFEPVFFISGKTGELTGEVMKAKIDLK